MNNDNQKIALVTGSNRGLGFEISRQLAQKGITVIMSARDPVKGEKACFQLQQEGLDVHTHILDVTDRDTMNNTVNWIREKFGKLHILVNNAGISLDFMTSVLDISLDVVEKTLKTNSIGPIYMCKICIPLMKETGYGRIVNMSSTLGSLKEIDDPNSIYGQMLGPSYRLSKTTLNSMMRLFAKELRGTNILINSACPGWVRTDMGGPNAHFSVEEGAQTPVWLATLPDNGPSGGFFNSQQLVDW